MDSYVFAEEPRFWRIIKLRKFRRTEGVAFDIMPMEALPRVDGIDRVIHQKRALSPGSVGEIERPWYIHTHQEDNLIVLQGKRTAEIYTVEYKRIETFAVTPEYIEHNGKVVYEGPAMVVWPTNVFHRIVTGDEGSASLNFALRYPGFDIDTAFNVYDLNTDTGEYRLLRKGSLDQYPG